MAISRRASVAVTALLLALPAGSLAQTKKVLVIGIDGVWTDVMAEAATPNIDALVAEGAWSMTARTTIPTISGPSWSSMLIGVWPNKHNVFNNNFEANRYGEYPDFLTRIESVRPELNTYVAGDWLPLVAEDSGGPLFGDAIDEVFAVDGYELGWAEADSVVTAAAVAALSTADPDAVVVYLGNPDETSHLTGSIGAEYRGAIEEADRQVGQLLAAVHSRPTTADEDWLILLSTDHGRRPNGGHGGRSEAELTSFFIAHGPSAVPGEIEGTPRVLDIAVTALAHLGIDADPAWELDGRVVGIEGAEAGWLSAAMPLRLDADDGTQVFGELHGDLANSRAVLLLFHQGGGNAHAEYAGIIPRLLRNGYAAIAVDARAGGNILGGTNRTMAAFEDEPHYCEAYPDLRAVLEYARGIAGELPIVAWGSSYSGALALRLASENADDLAGVLAFSPAGGEPMGECPANRFGADVTIPTMVLRPLQEAEIETVADQIRSFGELGFFIHVAEPGVHGSSMLDPARVEGDVEPTWEAVLEFLASVTARRR
ncbi:MAG: alkaline phosphatase family protein [Gemmatimonadota bacterium]|nr:alkaline phosphatase family protein [Gemmatimonadota bacterium]